MFLHWDPIVFEGPHFLKANALTELLKGIFFREGALEFISLTTPNQQVLDKSFACHYHWCTDLKAYMRILAIDPGTTHSAYVIWDNKAQKILSFDIQENSKLLSTLILEEFDWLAIEMIASYGMAVGASVFETCVWTGRFIQEALYTCLRHTKLYRKDIKMHLCGNTRAKDGNVKQALIDRLGAPGKKKTPGPTYGLKKDLWQALAVAVTFGDCAEAN
jgi:hypothetical protein